VRVGAAPGRAPAALRATIEALNLLYRRLNEAERDDASRAATEPIRAEIARRETELAARHRSVQLERGERPGAEPMTGTLVDLAALLGTQEAAVAYAFLADELHAFVVDRRGLGWTGAIAGRDEIETALGQWLFQAGKTALGGAYLSAHAEALRSGANLALGRLRDLVWSPIVPLLDGPEAVLVVPSGPLFYLPFHALWDGRRYLIEECEVWTAPSARALVALDRTEPREGAGNGALILGYEVDGLPGIELEVAAVKARIPHASVLSGPAATRAALRRIGGSASIVHLAAHAEFRGDNPLLSSIELADGRLTFYDLFDLHLDAKLVVLSGCQTGQSRVLEGDELMGLARGFQYAGARALIASLWPIEDAAAAELMGRFYGHLARGDHARAAFARAMRDGIDAGRLPHEWAPFYLSGQSTGEALVP
jgi:hypothetical protein